MRDELLSELLFMDLDHARQAIETWDALICQRDAIEAQAHAGPTDNADYRCLRRPIGGQISKFGNARLPRAFRVTPQVAL